MVVILVLIMMAIVLTPQYAKRMSLYFPLIVNVLWDIILTQQTSAYQNV